MILFFKLPQKESTRDDNKDIEEHANRNRVLHPGVIPTMNPKFLVQKHVKILVKNPWKVIQVVSQTQPETLKALGDDLTDLPNKRENDEAVAVGCQRLVYKATEEDPGVAHALGKVKVVHKVKAAAAEDYP